MARAGIRIPNKRMKAARLLSGALLASMIVWSEVSRSLASEALESAQDPVLAVMLVEVSRAKQGLQLEDQPAPYFIGFWIQERAEIYIEGKNGGIVREHPEFHPHRSGWAEVRVGNYDLDNTDLSAAESFGMEDFQEDAWGLWDQAKTPVGLGGQQIRTTLWFLADQAYKKALSDYQKKRGKTALAVREKLTDFSKEQPVKAVMPPPSGGLDIAPWRSRIEKTTLQLIRNPHVIDATMELTVERVTNYYVNTEGTTLRTGGVYYRLELAAKTMGKDGIFLDTFRHYATRDPNELPDQSVLTEEASQLAAELLDLGRAEELASYVGPAILDGDVAGVFLHEAIGHRLEGERQRKPQEGQTFKDKIGKSVLPDFLTLVDDPTLDRFDGRTLNGHYSYDEQGVPAQSVILVDKGILRNFLLSRTPIRGFERSNGHGRAEGPLQWRSLTVPAARMGNLILMSAKKTPVEKLKKNLMAEAKRQGKPYGLIVRRARSGETSTAAGDSYWGSGVQSWKARPVLVYTLDAQDGKETLMRGAELVGTPLTSLEKIIDTGDAPMIFNGHCGAESGNVPVSIVAPAVLTAQVEVQRTGGIPMRPPILPAPFHE